MVGSCGKRSFDNGGKQDSTLIIRKHSLSSSISQSLNLWRKPDSGNTSYKHLKFRRSKRQLKAVIAAPKSSSLSNSVKWALERLNVESVQTYTTDETLQLCLPGLHSKKGSIFGGKEPNASSTEPNCNHSNNSSSQRDQLPSLPNIVIVDARLQSGSKQFDYEAIAKTLRNTSESQHVVLVAVVKRCFVEKEDIVVGTLISSGFNRIMFDVGSRGYWLNELSLLLSNELEISTKMGVFETLLTSLDHCSDAVQIVDNVNETVVYTNAAIEKLTGYSLVELQDKKVWDFQGMASDQILNENDETSDIRSVIRDRLEQGLTWEGSLNCRRKSGDALKVGTKVIPAPLTSKRCPPDHAIFIQSLRFNDGLRSRRDTKVSQGDQNILFDALKSAKSRKSLKGSIRNTSLDYGAFLGPDGLHQPRRASKVSLTPINKVINIIQSAQKIAPTYLRTALDDVMEILQTSNSTELFAPELEDERKLKTADPVTNDLLGALLSNSTRDAVSTGRRSSYDVGGVVGSKSILAPPNAHGAHDNSSGSSRSMSITHHRHSAHEVKFRDLMNNERNNLHSGAVGDKAKDVLKNNHTWEFDILQLESITDSRCLVWLGMSTFLRFELHKTLKCSETTLQNWLALIEANYHSSNTYHNSTHAADVLHATAFFLERQNIKEICGDPIDEAVCLIAAAIHDVDHPGKNSAFLCNSDDALAKLYNDITVLENHHAALSFQLTTSDDRVNIFKNLGREDYLLMRRGIIDLVLATDMSKHVVHLNNFAALYRQFEPKSPGPSLASRDSGDDIVSADDSGEGGGDGAPTARADPSSEGEEEEESGAGVVGATLSLAEIRECPDRVNVVKRMLIKCADVSNPARPLHICKVWAHRIAEEYFTQTDEEKEKGMPVVMPHFDRTTCSIPKSQIGFYDFFINDMFDIWSAFTPCPQLTEIINANYTYWVHESEKEALAKQAETIKTLNEADGSADIVLETSKEPDNKQDN